MLPETTWEITRTADWEDGLPPIIVGNEAVDLTGKILELYIRPTYDHSVLLAKLSSFGEQGIVIDDAPGGLASFRLPRSELRELIPAGTWDQWLLLKEPVDDEDGFAIREVWRGQLIVRDGKV